MLSSNTSAANGAANYVEDVCSVYLRTGTGSSQTVTTGIKENTGALVISKSRSAATDWAWYDTFRGATYDLVSNSTAAQTTQAQGLTSFNADGHTWGTLAKVNTSGATYVDTVLKPTSKFFDVVTYTGTGSSRTVAHNLGSVPGCIIVKRTSGIENWTVYHQSQGANKVGFLNLTNAFGTNNTIWGNTSPTSTVFTVGDADAGTNANGSTYVAYIFAHDAGGFGLTGTDNVISCGSFTTDGSGNATINLGYEPQWFLEKNSSSAGDYWNLLDIARGQSNSSPTAYLFPNLSNAEASVGAATAIPTATGLNIRSHSATTTYIYIAIRRGPMKVPTDATKVFAPALESGSTPDFVTGFPVDFGIVGGRSGTNPDYAISRLQGIKYMQTNSTAAELDAGAVKWDEMNGMGSGFASTTVGWNFRRAPSFFDEVCYTGTGSATTFSHNLGVAPELMIVKKRSAAGTDWCVYPGPLSSPATKILFLDTTDAVTSGIGATVWNNTAATSSVFSVGTDTNLNASGATYVNYLFATCAGVSKVGSYTGTATTQQINCGFSAGARFVLIKRTDSTGDWYVWDSARGIVAGNDPYLLLNSTAAEVTSTDYIDPYSAGFELSSTAPAALNASGGTYIFLAIA